MVKTFAQKKGFSNHFDELVLAFKGGSVGGMSTNTVTLSLLSNRSPNYRGVDKPPWWEMPLELTKEATCQCGLHVSAKYVLNRKHMLSRVNVASVSLPAFTPASSITKWWRGLGNGKTKTVPYDDDPKTSDDDAEARWEYTTMLLFNIGGSLYTYHHIPNLSERWMTFENLARSYTVNGRIRGKGFFRIQDTLWLVWSLPDVVWQTRNPDFFKDDDGTDWLPKI